MVYRTAGEVRDLIRTGMKAHGGSQAEYAESIGVSAQYLSDVLRGKTGETIPEPIAAALGLRRVVRYVTDDNGNNGRKP